MNGPDRTIIRSVATQRLLHLPEREFNPEYDCVDSSGVLHLGSLRIDLSNALPDIGEGMIITNPVSRHGLHVPQFDDGVSRADVRGFFSHEDIKLWVCEVLPSGWLIVTSPERRSVIGVNGSPRIAHISGGISLGEMPTCVNF